MNPFFLRSTLFVLCGLFLCPPVAGLASPAPVDSVHFCVPFDYEQWRRDHPRPASKRLADLNVGVPRTVRMIYFLPNDRPFRQEVVDSMKVRIRRIQTFYAEQMQAYGYGDKTFHVETDAQGDRLVHRVDGQHLDRHYLEDTFTTVRNEIEEVFDLEANIYLIFIDNSTGYIGRGSSVTGGIGGRLGKSGGFAFIAAEPSNSTSTEITHVSAHELGHAFGLYHDFNSHTHLMSYGGLGLSQSRLSACHAEFLAVHPYFNPDVEAQAAPPPTIELISPLTYPAGSSSVAVQLELSDSEGLHQVFLVIYLHGSFEVWGCRGLAGEKDAVVEFAYDGYSGLNADHGDVTELSDFDRHPITVMAVDTEGNLHEERFELSEQIGHGDKTLEYISGDNQQGSTEAQLAHPLAVEVRDQNNIPLQGVQVRFVVVAGEGKLSGRFTVENATTDANGRAERTLTPGSGTNIVRAAVEGIEQFVTFNATGIGAPTSSILDGDYRTWHVPDNATARLGKGAIGESDRAVAFSPDGQRLAVASGIGVWIYDVASSRELALLPTADVQSVAFSPDGTHLASLGGGYGQEVMLWDIETQTPIATLSGHRLWVSSVAFSPDGTIAFRSRDEAVVLWDFETGNVATLEEKSGRESRWLLPLSVAFSRDGTVLASGATDGIIRLWDVETQTSIATLSGHRLSVSSVAFSHDGTVLASGAGDETVKLWDVETQTLIATLSGHTRRVTCVAFSRDGILASGSIGGTIKLWDVATRDLIATLEGHTSWIRSVSFSPDGKTLASGSSDGTVKLWDVETENVSFSLFEHTSWVSSVSFSADGKTLASGSGEGTVKLWDVETGRNIDRFGEFHQTSISVTAVSFSRDGTMLASGDNYGIVTLWDVATPELFATLEGHAGRITTLSFSPDDGTIASGSTIEALLWDTETGTRIATPLSSWIHSVSFSSDGSILAIGSDFGVKLWDVATQTRIATLSENERITSVAFSLDGTLASAGHSEVIDLWDVATHEQIATLEGHSLERYSGVVNTVAFSPDGIILASGGLPDGTVGLWDVGNRELIATLKGHSGSVSSVSFSPDGTKLASSSEDGTVLLWDLLPYTTPKKPSSDFDGDGTVGFSDFVQFAANFGLSQGDEGYDARFDLDGNGAIGFSDFLIFANAFGNSTGSA